MNNTTFLPEDYLAQKAERRTNIISLVLFVIVMAGVYFAFLWTNRTYTEVMTDQESINNEYVKAASQIDDLTELNNQRLQMLDKAELAAALVERVPRSILLAELVNRMPPRLSLLSFELQSAEIKKAVDVVDGKLGKLKPGRLKTRDEMADEIAKIEPPRYRVDLTLVGVAPTDLEVSRFMQALNEYELLEDVRLDYSEAKEIEDREMRQFKIHMAIDPEADIRETEPTTIERDINDPMSDEVRFGDMTSMQPVTDPSAADMKEQNQ